MKFKHTSALIVFLYELLLRVSAVPTTSDGEYYGHVLKRGCNQGFDCYVFCYNCCDKAGAKCPNASVSYYVVHSCWRQNWRNILRQISWGSTMAAFWGIPNLRVNFSLWCLINLFSSADDMHTYLVWWSKCGKDLIWGPQNQFIFSFRWTCSLLHQIGFSSVKFVRDRIGGIRQATWQPGWRLLDVDSAWMWDCSRNLRRKENSWWWIDVSCCTWIPRARGGWTNRPVRSCNIYGGTAREVGSYTRSDQLFEGGRWCKFVVSCPLWSIGGQWLPEMKSDMVWNQGIGNIVESDYMLER